MPSVVEQLPAHRASKLGKSLPWTMRGADFFADDDRSSVEALDRRFLRRMTGVNGMRAGARHDPSSNPMNFMVS